jgi:hypothetical protein
MPMSGRFDCIQRASVDGPDPCQPLLFVLDCETIPKLTPLATITNHGHRPWYEEDPPEGAVYVR